MNVENVIKRPLLTEKVSLETENYNRYGFEVDRKATKNQIKNAVETLFNVKVQKVNTSVVPGKIRRHGRNIKKAASWKRAFVTVAQGQKIELFKGI